MATDYQAIGTAIAGVVAAAGAVLTGIYTGRNARKKDQSESQRNLEEARFRRDQAEEEASAKRIEQIAQDAAEARRAKRELEAQYDRETRELRMDRQRGWDLARFHYGLVDTLVHILNNIFTAYDNGGGSTRALANVVGNAKSRVQAMKIPRSLEEPIPDRSRQTAQPEKDT